MKPHICIIILVFLSSNIFSQSPVVRNYTTNEGLPSSEVYFSIQDKKGYMWFATDMGVSRFDGYKFRNFDIQSGLPSNTIFEIFEDYKGRIWFSSFSGELSYYYNDSIFRYPYNDKLLSLFTESPLAIKNCFFVDSTDKITVGFYNQGIFEIFPDGQIIKKHSKNQYNTTHLIVDNKNEEPYVLTYYNSFYLNLNSSDYSFLGILKDNKFSRLKNSLFTPEPGARSNFIKKENGNYIYGYGNFIYEFKNTKLIFKRKMKDKIVSIGIDREQNLYVCIRNNGAYFYKNADISKPYSAHYLKNKTISNVFLDNEKAYWFSTLNNGVFYMGSTFYQVFNKTHGLSSNNTECIIMDKDNDVWIGTNDNYINLIHKDTIIKIRISQDRNIVIKDLCIENDKLWIGANNNLFFISNLTEQKLNLLKTNIINISKVKTCFSTKKLIKSKNSGVWIGESRSFRKIINNKIVFNAEEKNNYNIRTEALYELPNGDILLGTLKGLYKFKLANSKSIKGDFLYLGESNELLKKRILDIEFCEYCNNFWLATKGAGILIYNNDTVFRITTANGLTSNSITSIKHKDNVFYAGTNQGLNRITLINNDPIVYNIDRITIQNGLVSNEVRDVYISDSNIYVATKSGLTVFPDKKLPEPDIFPPVYITNVAIKGKDTMILKTYNLPYKSNSITIDYLGITYKNKGKLLYKHKLNGVDEEWITNSKTQAQYPYLPPGEYTFNVIANSNEGNWSLRPATINIIINKPFYKKNWFVYGVFILAVFIIGAIIFIITRISSKRNYLIKQALAYRQIALSNQMNPHFISNSLNSIQNFIMSNNKILSSKYLSDFSSLMRKILLALKNKEITLEKEIELLDLYINFELLRVKNKFKHEFIIDKIINTDKLYLPVFILQPLIENSIWHGFTHKEGECNLIIKFTLKYKSLICEIIDNGVGRKQAAMYRKDFNKNHKSTAFSNIKKRLDIISKLENKETGMQIENVLDEKKNIAGTKVTIILPIKTKKESIVNIQKHLKIN